MVSYYVDLFNSSVSSRTKYHLGCREKWSKCLYTTHFWMYKHWHLLFGLSFCSDYSGQIQY